MNQAVVVMLYTPYLPLLLVEKGDEDLLGNVSKSLCLTHTECEKMVKTKRNDGIMCDQEKQSDST